MSTAASIALILLMIEALICTLAPLGILIGLVYGLRKARQGLAQALPKAQGFTAQAARTTHTVSNRIVEPLIRAHMTADQLWAVIASIRARAGARFFPRRVRR
ncbi:MAG: hypothetical protein RMN25_01645 [Anaerolineae bacterium]|nr:hypothetical protein [Thermoflexales bacterium]MDW8406458.1 hypothetical protein [Anaerolineae bacterium]